MEEKKIRPLNLSIWKWVGDVNLYWTNLKLKQQH